MSEVLSVSRCLSDNSRVSVALRRGPAIEVTVERQPSLMGGMGDYQVVERYKIMPGEDEICEATPDSCRTVSDSDGQTNEAETAALSYVAELFSLYQQAIADESGAEKAEILLHLLQTIAGY